MIHLSFDPVLAWLGPLPLAWHGILSSLGIYAGVWLAARLLDHPRWQEAGVPGSLFGWASLGALVGARLFHVADHLADYVADPLSVLAIWRGGIAVYGGFVGALAGAALASRRAGLPVWPLLDAAGPALLLGQAIGRLGCFANGDAWGAPTGGAWGVVYEHPGALLPPELLGVPTHPYPLYEAAADLTLLGVLLLVRRRAPLGLPGRVFLLAAVGYGAIRFTLTFLRQEPVVLWGLQEAQVLALVTGLAAWGALLAQGLAARRAGRSRGSSPVSRPAGPGVSAEVGDAW
jgi:phosphatidylglycerol---prolipoprotein diacylglyceryl transferase